MLSRVTQYISRAIKLTSILYYLERHVIWKKKGLFFKGLMLSRVMISVNFFVQVSAIAKAGPGVYIQYTRCTYMAYMYGVYCFSQNLKRFITSSAVTALEIEKYECLRLVKIYRMARENLQSNMWSRT